MALRQLGRLARKKIVIGEYSCELAGRACNLSTGLADALINGASRNWRGCRQGAIADG